MNDLRLFPKELLTAIDQFSVQPEWGGTPYSVGQHHSPYPGDSSEFQDFRSYTPGDDLRRIDWNIYRRSQKLLLRQYRNFPQKNHYIYLDTSESIRCRANRALTAWRLAALLGGVLLNNGDNIALKLNDSGFIKFPASGHSLPRFMAALTTSFQHPEAQSPISYQLPTTGHCWVISDFMAPEGLDQLERQLHRAPGFTPIRIYEPEEWHPELKAEVRLIDSETGQEVTIQPDDDLLAAYQKRLQRLNQALTIPAGRIHSQVYNFSAAQSLHELLFQAATELFQGGRR